MNVKPVKVALIGSGNISYTYLNTMINTFKILDVVGCSDLIPEKSRARSELFGIRQMTNEEILSDPEIEIVVNTTNIWAHTDVSRMILNAGKHCYSEKMAGCTYEEAKATVDLAKSKGLRFGAAPDTYMGSGYQTARKLIDDGMIGTPIMAQAICMRQGWGANSPGGRPGAQSIPGAPTVPGGLGTTIPYDMGGYYINALVSLLGPVNRASGYSRFNGDSIYTNVENPLYGEKLQKQAGSTMMMGCLEFVNGCYGNFVIMGESFNPEVPRVEIFGTKGNLICPDPNMYGNWGFDVYLSRIGNSGTFKMPFTHAYGESDPSIPSKSGKPEPGYAGNRGMAVAEMAWAIRRNRPHRSSAELALHAVEIVSSIDKSTADNKVYTMRSRPEQPKPLTAGLFGPSAEASLDC
jgi:predicted dehydrogenase